MCRGPAIRLPSVISVSSRRSRSGQARRSGWSFTRISSSPLREVVDMAAIKLGKLPDRTPVKLTISILPDLKQALDDYARSEEHTSELQSLMRISYAVFCLKQNIETNTNNKHSCHT